MAALGSKTLQAPRRQEHTRGVHKRAYAQISVKGGGKASCSGGITAIESNVQKTHSALMSTEGGRLTPQPVLESFEMANDGGQDASDAMLFEASAKVKVFSLGDLNDMENSFLVPGQRISIKLGYAGGSSDSIDAEIVGYDFTINQDSSFDVTIKAGGKLDGVVSADFFTLSSSTPIEYTDEESGKTITPSDILGNIIGESSQKLKGLSPSDGRAKKNGPFAICNHQMEESTTWYGGNNNLISYVAASYIIDSINKNINPKLKIKNPLFTYNKLFVESSNSVFPTEIKSADPLSIMISGNGTYGSKAQFDIAAEGSSVLGKLYVSIPAIAKIQEDLTMPPGSDSKKSVATVDYLKKIFALIDVCTGGYVRPYIYSDPNSSETGRGEQMLILNKGSDFEPSQSPTLLKVLDGYSNGVRSYNVSTNMDSEMMAMALHAAQTGKGGDNLKNLYPGCFDTLEPENSAPADYKSNLAEVMETLGDNIGMEEITTAKQSLKAYVESISKKTQPIIKYNLEVSFQCDGYFGARYADAFTIDRLPKSLKAANAYFIVSKIGQNFSNGDWVTDITGIMMLGK
mgnify:CR=1 FL=1|jgi:hypothetical protein